MYFQIIAFNHPDDVDNICQTHIYPTYISCMQKDKMMLQSNPHDGLKFTSREKAQEWLERAKKAYPKKELVIIQMDPLFFGKKKPRWIV